MTRAEAITELVRIWHSPHLDLSLKAGLGEAIDALKENNRIDSLVRDEADDCKESESKLDLISRADAIGVLMETMAPPSVTLDTLVMRIDALPSAEARPTVIRSRTLLPTKDFMEWAKRIREINPNAVVIPCDAEAPSPEVRPTGEWIQKDMYADRFCSECNYAVWDSEAEEYNFCPNCGAKMYKGGDDE